MTYAEAIDWLFTLNRFGMKLGLENIRTLTDAVGRPQQRFDAILVAGTNGKGSTAAMLHAMLLAAGIPAGLFTSPHLVRAEERIRIGPNDIDPAMLTTLLNQLRTKIDQLMASGQLGAHPTFFEVTTTAAFIAFARAEVRAAVLEVGLGGRLDATNVVEPVLSIITGIDFDHMEQLGSTLDAIAREKAGIFRKGKPALVGDLSEEPLAAVREVAAKVRARLTVASHGSTVSGPRQFGPGLLPEFSVQTPVRAYPRLSCPLAGTHQLRNALVAIRAAELLEGPRLPIGEQAIVDGLARTRWPGRLEWVEGRPALLLDGAHNPAGIRTLVDHLAAIGKSPVLLFGAMKDKEARQMLEILLPRARAIVFTAIPMERASEPEALLATATSLGLPHLAPDDYHADGDLASALAAARRLAGPEGLVVATGSLYLVGALKALLEQAPFRPAETR